MKKASLLFRTVQQRLDGVNGVIQENLTGIRLIRVFVRMGYEIERFTVFSGNLMRSTVSALRLTETTMPFVMLIVNAAILAILWFGRIAISNGEATLGQTVAVINYSLRTIGALSAISGLVVTFSRARASSQRVSEVMEAGAGVREGGTLQGEPIQGHVKFEGVCFKYPNSDISVLEDIHFEVAAGERVAIMGATGSGKSSFVSLIPRLYEETDGTIWIDGEKSADIDISRLRKSIGYVPQELQLFSGSIRDNIAWGNEHATLEQIQQAAGAAQIHETVKGLPDGYDTMLGQRGVNLSGGQKQRLTIARALVRKWLC